MSSSVPGILRGQDGFLVDLDLSRMRPSRCLLFLLTTYMSATLTTARGSLPKETKTMRVGIKGNEDVKRRKKTHPIAV
jgi:hypothetical protein